MGQRALFLLAASFFLLRSKLGSRYFNPSGVQGGSTLSSAICVLWVNRNYYAKTQRGCFPASQIQLC